MPPASDAGAGRPHHAGPQQQIAAASRARRPGARAGPHSTAATITTGRKAPGISQVHSTPAAVMPQAEHSQQRGGRGRVLSRQPAPDTRDGDGRAEEAQQQQQPDHAELGARLHEQRVRVPDEVVERPVLGPPGLVPRRAHPPQRLGLEGLPAGLPELVAAGALRARQVAGHEPTAGHLLLGVRRRLELVPALHRVRPEQAHDQRQRRAHRHDRRHRARHPDPLDQPVDHRPERERGRHDHERQQRASRWPRCRIPRPGAPVGEEVARQRGEHEDRRSGRRLWTTAVTSRTRLGTEKKQDHESHRAGHRSAARRRQEDAERGQRHGGGGERPARSRSARARRAPPAARRRARAALRERSSSRAGSSAARASRPARRLRSASGKSEGTIRLASATTLSATSPIRQTREPAARAARGRGHHHEREHPGVTRPRAGCRRKLLRRPPPSPSRAR